MHFHTYDLSILPAKKSLFVQYSQSTTTCHENTQGIIFILCGQLYFTVNCPFVIYTENVSGHMRGAKVHSNGREARPLATKWWQNGILHARKVMGLRYFFEVRRSAVSRKAKCETMKKKIQGGLRCYLWCQHCWWNQRWVWQNIFFLEKNLRRSRVNHFSKDKWLSKSCFTVECFHRME